MLKKSHITSNIPYPCERCKITNQKCVKIESKEKLKRDNKLIKLGYIKGLKPIDMIVGKLQEKEFIK